MINPKSQNQPPHGSCLPAESSFFSSTPTKVSAFKSVYQTAATSWYAILPSPTLLESALVRLFWQAAGVSLLGERSCVCLPKVWEKRSGEMGIVRVGTWSCCGVQVNSSRSCALHSHLQHVCADTTLHYVDL